MKGLRAELHPSPHRLRPSGLPSVLVRRSPLLVGLFKRYIRRYLRRHFHAIRLARGGRPDVPPDGALVVVLNHPSWWDPLVCAILSELFPGRAHFAPIDAVALGRYRLFGHLGFFGIRPGTSTGAWEFLRVGEAVLAWPGNVLWVTAQGRFSDVRQRPPGLEAGVGHLARRLRGAVVVPLALEYTFWDERQPEALARFGTPLIVEDGRARAARYWLSEIELRLATAQDALADDARRRDPSAFEVLLAGRTGIGGVYDWWRRLRAWGRGETFRSEHGQSGLENSSEGVP